MTLNLTTSRRKAKGPARGDKGDSRRKHASWLFQESKEDVFTDGTKHPDIGTAIQGD